MVRGDIRSKCGAAAERGGAEISRSSQPLLASKFIFVQTTHTLTARPIFTHSKMAQPLPGSPQHQLSLLDLAAAARVLAAATAAPAAADAPPPPQHPRAERAEFNNESDVGPRDRQAVAPTAPQPTWGLQQHPQYPGMRPAAAHMPRGARVPPPPPPPPPPPEQLQQKSGVGGYSYPFHAAPAADSAFPLRLPPSLAAVTSHSRSGGGNVQVGEVGTSPITVGAAAAASSRPGPTNAAAAPAKSARAMEAPSAHQAPARRLRGGGGSSSGGSAGRSRSPNKPRAAMPQLSPSLSPGAEAALGEGGLVLQAGRMGGRVGLLPGLRPQLMLKYDGGEGGEQAPPPPAQQQQQEEKQEKKAGGGQARAAGGLAGLQRGGESGAAQGPGPRLLAAGPPAA